MSTKTGFFEHSGLEVDELVTLEKIDDATGQLVEKIQVHNGVVISHEFFEIDGGDNNGAY